MNQIKNILIVSAVFLIVNAVAQPSKLKMKKTPSGLEYVIFKSNKGPKIDTGDLVYFKFKGIVSDSALYSSYRNTHTPYMSFVIQKKYPKANFEEGILLLRKGDSAMFMVNSDSFFKSYVGSPPPAFIKKGEPIHFYVKIDSFVTSKVLAERKIKEEEALKQKQANEYLLVDDYVKKTGLNFTRTSTGMYYVITVATQGAKAEPGDKIGAVYTGKLLNGKVFDSNKTSGAPFEFELGAHQVISGWDEIFSILHEGEKATIVLPSSLAYGANGAGADILPYSPLVFDVEFISIKRNPKAQSESMAEPENNASESNEAAIIENYIKATGQKFTKTKSGLNYLITHVTQGEKANPGDRISAIYTGKLLNGKVFDSNKQSGRPFEFMLGVHQVIAGWDEIFSILKVGETATIVIPSALGYGANGAGADIKPYSPLVFDVEFINVTRAQK